MIREIAVKTVPAIAIPLGSFFLVFKTISTIPRINPIIAGKYAIAPHNGIKPTIIEMIPKINAATPIQNSSLHTYIIYYTNNNVNYK